MTRRLAGLVVAAGLAAGLVAGCGIPEHTAVKVDRAGPVSGSNAETSSTQEPPGRLAAASLKEFVANYLTAAAGEFDAGGKAIQRLQDYVTAEAAPNVSLKSGAAVVEVDKIDVKPNDRDVELTVRHLGVLNAAGEILQPTETTGTYDLQVRAEEGGGWRLTKVPSVALLNVEALSTYYSERTLYFWNTDRTALVPDLRWLPREVPPSRVPTELLEMIEGGPAPWLEGVASPLPEDSKLLSNAPIDNDQLTMNWSPAAVGNDAQDYLAQQVAWTMRASGSSPRWLQIKINGQARPKQDVTDLLNRTPYPVGPEPHGYTIVDGKVNALAEPAGVPAPVPLAAAVNQGLRWAAVNRTEDGVDAAVVPTSGELRVGSAAAGGTVTAVAPVPGMAPTSPPVWLPGSRMGLVTTANGLYAFGPDRTARKLDPKGLRGITAVAAAPDGQRIGLIADRRLYIVPVSIGQDGLNLLAPREVVAPLRDLTAVAFSGETALSVAGTDAADRLSITDVTVDGARRTPRIWDAHGPITMIAAYPENLALGRSTNMLYEADNATWLARGSSTQLGRSALDGATATPSPAPDDRSQPTAPFYVY